MPICPKCGKEISYLRYGERAINTAKFDGHDYYSWDTVHIEDYWYECPECNAMLFTDDGEAEKFFENKP
jgi:ribosomal protein S27AE